MYLKFFKHNFHLRSLKKIELAFQITNPVLFHNNVGALIDNSIRFFPIKSQCTYSHGMVFYIKLSLQDISSHTHVNFTYLAKVPWSSLWLLGVAHIHPASFIQHIFFPSFLPFQEHLVIYITIHSKIVLSSTILYLSTLH